MMTPSLLETYVLIASLMAIMTILIGKYTGKWHLLVVTLGNTC
jgi:hypothetical protein